MRRAVSAIREFLKLEAAGGLLLVAAACVALVLANSPLAFLYGRLLDVPVEVRVGTLHLAKPLLLWINDGLMAIFFLLVGLEIKREMVEGQLSSWELASLPAMAAVGGMAAPAAVYAAINWHSPGTLAGWAIPAATDIAFALGALSLAGPRVPSALKILLLALAIIDDLGAIVIIALFYTDHLAWQALVLAAVGIGLLAALNRARVLRLSPYILVGAAIWVCVLKSGVHATLAGVAVALFVPVQGRDDEGRVPLKHLERMLHPWVAYGIMPIFAFANAGVSFAGMTPASLLTPVPLGIALGLFLGKQLGVVASSWIAIRLGLCRLPKGVTWGQFYGTAVLTGIGFTMSLFIGTLAFDDLRLAADVRLGVLAGSLLSAVAGYALVRAASR